MKDWEGLLGVAGWPELGEWEQWMQYALEGGGKRLRPKLVWETYRLYAPHTSRLRGGASDDAGY
jgi:geranylgeranyl pyrophosphate synthase